MDQYSQQSVNDPRFCITLDGWLKVGLNPATKLVISLRHPIGVTRSLMRRNKIPQWLAFYLWRVHYERLMETLASNSELNVHYLSYSALVSPDDKKRDREIKRLMTFAGTDTHYSAQLLSSQIKVRNEDFKFDTHTIFAQQASRLWTEITSLARSVQ